MTRNVWLEALKQMNTKFLIAAGSAALFLIAGSAEAKIYDFSFSNSVDSGSGVFTVTGTGPTYTVTGVTGMVDGQAITGLSGYGVADELLSVPPGAPADVGGIAFSTSADTYNVYAYTGGPWLIKASVDPVGEDPTHGSPLASFTITAVPEPASWAAMLVGFGAVGAAMRRRRAVAMA
jgi:hypothetical protein